MLLIFFVTCDGTPAQADDCTLKLLTSVQLVSSTDRTTPMVPVTLQGRPELMVLDTGGAFSMITNKTASDLALPSVIGDYKLYDLANNYVDHYVTPSLTLGTLSASHVRLYVAPSIILGDVVPSPAGILGPDVLTHYDVDVDFGTGKFNLISQDHCEGKVVYWPASVVAVVPIQVLDFGHIIVPVKLDGQDELALLDTGSYNTTLFTRIAQDVFGLKLGSADSPVEGALTDDAGAATYRHQFKTLEIEGISVKNPQVILIPDRARGIRTQSGVPELGTRIPTTKKNESKVTMLVGMNVLRHFHIYIAYREQKLYITPAAEQATPAESAVANPDPARSGH